ncbi:hypothetical protein BDQ17DRAFT_1420035 [Cyathus striatus]|nr:hypothetical protein BDQ17DRAFT_1420035 [Cyathus striatus]
MSIAFDEQPKPESLTRVVFHIANAVGLSDEINRQVPKTLAAYVSVEGPDISSGKYDLTSSGFSSDKSQQTWNDNLQALDSEITFCVNHLQSRTPLALPFKKQRNIVLAQTDRYVLSDLYKMQAEADANVVSSPGNGSPRLNRNTILLPLHTDSKSKTQANLVISVCRILEGAEFQEQLQRDLDEIQKKNAAQDELESYLSRSARELTIAESSMPGSSSTTKKINRIHIAIGAIASVSKVVINHYTESDIDAIQLASTMYETIAQMNAVNNNDIFHKYFERILLSEIISASSHLNHYFVKCSSSIKNNVQVSKTCFLNFQDIINRVVDGSSSSSGDGGDNFNILTSNDGRLPLNVQATSYNSRIEELNPIEMKPPSIPNNNIDFSEPIQNVSKWLLYPNKHQPNIFHIYGPTGSGKGALITHLVEEFRELGYMKGYFSFQPLSEGNTSMLGMLVPTLAFQLAKSLPGIMGYICKALEETPEILQYDLKSQFDKLLRRPLEAFEADIDHQYGKGYFQPIMIVLDKLDKCDTFKDEDLNLLLDLLTTELCTLPCFVHILVVSRPMENIKQKLSANPSVMKHELYFLGQKNPNGTLNGEGKGHIKYKGPHNNTGHTKKISLLAKMKSNLDAITEAENSLQATS